MQIYIISIIAALAGLLFGFDTGVISGAILFINQDFQLTAFQTELVVSSVLIGAILGAISSGLLSDLIGRKKIILITACIFCCGTIVCGFSPSLLSLIIGRLILGFAIGIASFAAPLYLAELAPKSKRGFLVSLNQLAVTIGILTSYLVNYYFSFSGSWRLMLLFGLIPAIGLLLGTYLLPESPRFLISKGKEAEARTILAKLKNNIEIEQELKEVKNAALNTYRWQTLFNNKRAKKILLTGIILAVTQQITGINTIIYYAPTIFKLAGFQTTSAILVTALVGITNVIFTIIALPLLDRIGRRTLLSIGLSGMIISLMILGFSFHQAHMTDALRILTLLSMIIYIACFAISLGPIVFLLLAEIFPQKIRGAAMSLSMAANWLSNFIVALTFLSLVNHIGTANTFYLYALISIGTLFFIFYFIPETKGHSLEQIEAKLYPEVQIH